MAPLTWRNVDAPSFAGSNDLLRYAGQAFNSGFDAADSALAGFQDATTVAESNALMAKALKYQDPAAMAEALKNGTMLSGVNPRNLNPASIDMLNNRVGDLTADQQDAAKVQSTRLLNDVTGFEFGNAQEDRARFEGQLAQQPAAYKLFTEAAAMAASGDPAQYERAVQTIRNNSNVFTAAGISPDAVLGQLDANKGRYTGGIELGFTERAAGDQWEGIADKDTAKKAVAEATKGLNLEAAKRTVQGMDISVAAKRAAIADLEANAGADFAKPGMAELLIQNSLNSGAPAGMASQEAGNDPTAVNKDNGAAGLDQITQPRLDDAISAGVVPKGTTLGDITKDMAVQAKISEWHWGKINSFIADPANGVQQYLGQTINGVPITLGSMRAMAQLGGEQGMKKFLETGGKYDPDDGVNGKKGTKLSDYGKKFAGVEGDPSSAEALIGQAAAPAIAPVAPAGYSPSAALIDSASALDPTASNPGAATSQMINNDVTTDNILNTLAPIDNAVAAGKFANKSLPEIAQELHTGALSDMPLPLIQDSIKQVMEAGKISADMAAILVENNVDQQRNKNFLTGEKPILDQLFKTTSFAEPTIDIPRALKQLKAYKDPSRTGDMSAARTRITEFQNQQGVAPSLEVLDGMLAQAQLEYQSAKALKAEKPSIDLDQYAAKYAAMVKYVDQMKAALDKVGVVSPPVEEKIPELVK